jgi:hypothetical protein
MRLGKPHFDDLDAFWYSGRLFAAREAARGAKRRLALLELPKPGRRPDGHLHRAARPKHRRPESHRTHGRPPSYSFPPTRRGLYATTHQS